MKKSTPITTRIKHSMSGSPLHQNGEDKVVDASGKDASKSNDPVSLGPMVVNDEQGFIYDASDEVTAGTEGTPATPPKVVEKKLPSYEEAYKNVDKDKYPTIEAFVEASEEFKKNNPEKFKEMSTTTVAGTEGTEGTEGKRTTDYKPKVTEGQEASKVDTFLPWEARWANRTQNVARRGEIKRGKRAVKALERAAEQNLVDTDSESYKSSLKQAKLLASGAGNISLGGAGVQGGAGEIQGTERFDAILSQGMQANPVTSTETEFMRDLKKEQKGGQQIKGTGQMTKAEYEAGGKVKSTPKTSAAVQDESSKAGELPSLSTTILTANQSRFDRDGDPSAEPIPDFKRDKVQTTSVKPKPIPNLTGNIQSPDLIKINRPERPSSSDMFGGLSTVELTDLSEALQDQKNQATNEANQFIPGSIQANTGTGNRSDMAEVEVTGPKPSVLNADNEGVADGTPYAEVNESVVTGDVDGTPTAEENKSIIANPLKMKKGYKMNRSHSPRMMYNNGPIRKMHSPINKLTDLSGDGEITQKDVLIGRGVLNRDGSPATLKKSTTAFKMKGFGNKNK